MADQSFAKSFQKRIVVSSAVGMLAVGIIVALAGILPLAVQLREAHAKNLKVDLRRQTRMVEQFVANARRASVFRFARGQMRERLDAYERGQTSLAQFKLAAEQAMRESISQSTNTAALYLLGLQTNVLAHQGRTIPRELWVIPEADAEETILTGPHRMDGEPWLVSASALRNAQGARTGSAMALYRMTALRSVIDDYAGLGETGETIIGDLSNKEQPIFFPSRASRTGVSPEVQSLAAVRQALGYAQEGLVGVMLPDSSTDSPVVLAYGPIEGASWGLIIKQDRAELFAPVNFQLARIGAITFGLVLLGAAGMVLLLRPLTGRVILHTDELESEIYEKTAALNTELGERTRAEKSLRDSEALYHSLVDTLPINILRKDLAGRVTYGNKGYSEMMGKPMSELVGKTDFELFPRDLATKYSRDDDKVVQTAQMFEDVEENRLPGGLTTYVHVLKAPVRNARGDIVGTQVIFWDVTGRKQAELSLAQANSDLARSNKELEQFAYVASHDLQEPLRMITSYTQLIARRYNDKLDHNAREFMDFAVKGALRMQRLIHDLLAYSRVGTRGKAPEPTPAGEMLDAALDNLKLAVEETAADITRDPLPTVMADATQLTQLFQNLIGNAVKFRGTEKPRIHVSAVREAAPYCNVPERGAAPSRRQPDEWRFSVRDNGLGIEQQYFERIFVIFQRLHAVEHYPGTGIGLAICKKIVERHGGRIWVESTPGNGAAFHFTLPVIEQG